MCCVSGQWPRCVLSCHMLFFLMSFRNCVRNYGVVRGHLKYLDKFWGTGEFRLENSDFVAYSRKYLNTRKFKKNKGVLLYAWKLCFFLFCLLYISLLEFWTLFRLCVAEFMFIPILGKVDVNHLLSLCHWCIHWNLRSTCPGTHTIWVCRYG